jgi:hypothetical protein
MSSLRDTQVLFLIFDRRQTAADENERRLKRICNCKDHAQREGAPCFERSYFRNISVIPSRYSIDFCGYFFAWMGRTCACAKSGNGTESVPVWTG